MRPVLGSLIVFALGLPAQSSIGGEYTFQTSRVGIPAGKSVTLNSDDALEVDMLQVDGEITLEGYSLRIDTSTLMIGDSGVIRGYSEKNVPNPPPPPPAFGFSAAPGKDAPAQGSAIYMGPGGAGAGAMGTNGKDGDSGNPGNQHPGSLMLIAESLKFDGSVALVGQAGSVGQSGQDGQPGGTGGRGSDAYCWKDNTSTLCISGFVKSGPGGLGGFGGQGGPGGPGGAAAPIMLITYSNSVPNLERISSQPGGGGDRGDPGNLGLSGSAGGPGMSCSATANWGSFFGACSMNGGPVTTKVLTDEREMPIYATGDKGITGPTADWNRDPTTAFLLSKGSKPQNGVLTLHIDLSDAIKASRHFALRVELAGRMATTLLRFRDEYKAAPVDYRQSLEHQFQIELLPVITRAAGIIDLNQVVSLIEGISSEPLSARIDAAIPLLRESFKSERKGLLSACTQIRSDIKRSLGDQSLGYFQRVLSWCSATQLTWLPFITGQQRVVFKTPDPIVGGQFQPYFTVVQTSQESNSAQVGGTFVVTDSGDRRGDSQMVTRELVEYLQNHLAPSGRYLFSVARSREFLDDVLALDRSASLIRTLAR